MTFPPTYARIAALILKFTPQVNSADLFAETVSLSLELKHATTVTLIPMTAVQTLAQLNPITAAQTSVINPQTAL
jgi:hypothetical protein